MAASTVSEGFEITGALFSDTECDAIANIMAKLSDSARAGVRHLLKNAAVASIAADARLLAVAQRHLGHGAVPFRATLFAKSKTANWIVPWHQDIALPVRKHFDSPGWVNWRTKEGIMYADAPAWALSRVIALRLHLDESGPDNGPLRVIPGSHENGVLSGEAVREFASTHAPVACTAARGGVVAMRPLLIHASSKTTTDRPRRVLHIEYADSLELAPDIRLALA